jgi:hypothetical protein
MTCAKRHGAINSIAEVLLSAEPDEEGTLMQHWEYSVADFTKLEKAVPELDRLGAEGWEAVGLVTTWGAGWRMAHPVVLLKRSLPESEQ